MFSINAFKCTELHLTRLSCELTNIYKGHHNKVNTNWWWGALHCPTLVSFVSLVDPRPLCGLGESVKYRVSHCPNYFNKENPSTLFTNGLTLSLFNLTNFFWESEIIIFHLKLVETLCICWTWLSKTFEEEWKHDISLVTMEKYKRGKTT